MCGGFVLNPAIRGFWASVVTGLSRRLKLARIGVKTKRTKILHNDQEKKNGVCLNSATLNGGALTCSSHITAQNRSSAPSCDHFGRYGEWKNIWRLKFWRKSPLGDWQIIKETYLENYSMFGRIIKSKSDDFTYLSISRRFVTWNECVDLKWA